MPHGSERSENARFEHKKTNFCLKLKIIYMLV
jgi:hypothetical protein